MGCQLCKPAIDQSEREQSIDVIPSKPDTGAANELAEASKDAAQKKKKKEFLSKVKLFQRLPKDQHDILSSVCIEETFAKDYKLIKQGDEGHEFYIIVSGSVSVDVDGKKVATLATGDYLGENALLRDEPRNASITADADVTVLKITRAKFQEMGLSDKLEFKKRAAVAGGGGGKGDVVTKPPSVKTTAEKADMMKALKANTNLSDIIALDDEKCTSLINVAWEEDVPAGKAVIEQGSDQADYFYIVKSGTFDVYVKKDQAEHSAEETLRDQSQQVGSIPAGGSFGELALIFYAPRAATVKAKDAGVVWVIDRGNFKNIIATAAENKAMESLKYIDQNSFFSCLLKDEKIEVAKALGEAHFAQGEVIYDQGDKATSFYLLLEGEVEETKDGKTTRKIVGVNTSKAPLFGEDALLKGDKRDKTTKVVSATARTVQMDRKAFEMLLAPYDQIKKRGAKGATLVGNKNAEAQMMVRTPSGKANRPKFVRKDFNVLGLLGTGGFGSVELVEHKQTKDTYALKALSKGHVVKCRMQKSVIQEKTIQYMCESPFIVKLHECFNESQTLCFLLEPALGGELYDTYCKKGFHGSLKHAQFYGAATLFAFEHLHEKKVVFRDLKPENLLLTDGGFCKLTDMGLAKIVVSKTMTTCGTPDYFAPEVIAGCGHAHAVDWWTLGILIFELIAGHPPFETANPAQTMKKIQAGIEKVTFPTKLKGAGQDLMYGLLKKAPNDRLPMKKGWTENVKNHAWYDKFDWKKMSEDKLDPPYKPIVKSKTDMKNFSASAADKPPTIPYTEDGTGWDKDFAT